jgi:hypothetical protein
MSTLHLARRSAGRSIAWLLVALCSVPPPMAAQQVAGVSPLAPPTKVDVPDSMTDADRALQEKLIGEVQKIDYVPPTPAQVKGIADPNSTYSPKDPKGMNLALGDQMGLILVRDRKSVV